MNASKTYSPWSRHAAWAKIHTFQRLMQLNNRHETQIHKVDQSND